MVPRNLLAHIGPILTRGPTRHLVAAPDPLEKRPSPSEIEEAQWDNKSEAKTAEGPPFEKLLIDGRYSSDHHPGKVSGPTVSIPETLRRAITKAFPQSPIREQVMDHALKVVDIFNARKLPMEHSDLTSAHLKIELDIFKEEGVQFDPENPNFSEMDLDSRLQKRMKGKLSKRLRCRVQQKKALNFRSEFYCFAYLGARLAPDFAATSRALREIFKRIPNFEPKSVLEFSSRFCSSYWITQTFWPNLVDLYYFVDQNPVMNQIADTLLRGGIATGPLPQKGITFRQFLTSPDQGRRFDLVISAFSLLEFPSAEQRFAALGKLWENTGQFLVLMEVGNVHGYSALMEAREHIIASGETFETAPIKNKLMIEYGWSVDRANDVVRNLKRLTASDIEGLSQLIKEKEIPLTSDEFKTLMSPGHVFAPCPHDKVRLRIDWDQVCPKRNNEALGKVCKFPVKFTPVSSTKRKNEEVFVEEFCFVILRKGPRDTDEPLNGCPRLINKPSKSTTNRSQGMLCQANGKIKDSVCFKRVEHGVRMLNIMKKAQVGDIIPTKHIFLNKKESLQTDKQDVTMEMEDRDST